MQLENYNKIIKYVQSTDKKGLNQAYNRVFNSNNKLTKVDLIQCCAVLDIDNVKENYTDEINGFDYEAWICDFLDVEFYEIDYCIEIIRRMHKNR